MAAKRVSSKSEDSFDEIFNDFYSKSVDLYKEIDNWSARINSLRTLDISQAEFHFLDVLTFLEFFNFLTGEFDLLYHGKIVDPEGGPILRTMDGYSHDFLKSHLQNIKKQIKKSSKSKETMDAKWEEIDLKFWPNGKTLDDGLKLLKSIINELMLIRNLKKKFEITMKETASNTPYVKICEQKTKKREILCRYKSVEFEKELRQHSWKPKPQARKKQKKEVAESSTIQKKAAAVSTTITTISSEKAVQSNSKGRRGLIVDDDHEDLSQATSAGNVTSSKLQEVQFELPETATKDNIVAEAYIIQQSFEQNEVAPIQTPHSSLITAYPFTNSNAISIIKEEGSSKELIGMMVKDYLISEEENARGNFDHIVHSIKLFKELGWSFHDFFIGFEEMVMTVRKNLLQDTPPIQDSMVVTIKKGVIAKNREDRIATNYPEINNSYLRARVFIKNFSSQIFEKLFTNARMLHHLIYLIQLQYCFPSYLLEKMK